VSLFFPRSIKRQSRIIGSDHQLFRAVRLRTNRHEYGTVADRNLVAPLLHVGGDAREAMGGAEDPADARPVQSRVARRYDARGNLRAKAEARRLRASLAGLKGMRASTAVVLLVVTVLVMGGIWLAGRIDLNNRQRSLDDLRGQLTRSIAVCDNLQDQITAAKDDNDAAYKAKDLGLVSSRSLPLTVLTAPEGEFSPLEDAGDTTGYNLAIIYGE